MRTARLLPLALLLAVPALAHAATTKEVTTAGSTFSPPSTEVAVGDTVHWTNAGGSHNVHFDGEAALAPADGRTDMGSKTFTVAGTFSYRCDIHGDFGMTG